MKKKYLDFLGTEVWYNIKRTIIIFTFAFLFTAIFIAVWLMFRAEIYRFFGFNDGKRLALELGSDLTVFMPGMLYGTLQGFVINRIMGQNSRIRSAIDTLNARAFLEERDRRASYLVHIMIFCVSVLTIGMASLYEYATIEVGIYALGTCAFLASLALFVAIELDNPFSGAGRIPPGKIPEGWREMTIHDIVAGKVPDYDYMCMVRRPDGKNVSALQ